LAASPLMDAAAFTRDLESLYREMWREWCAKQSSRERRSMDSNQ